MVRLINNEDVGDTTNASEICVSNNLNAVIELIQPQFCREFFTPLHAQVGGYRHCHTCLRIVDQVLPNNQTGLYGLPKANFVG
jgi:hypothetical protein